jgi:hypothetical protein
MTHAALAVLFFACFRLCLWCAIPLVLVAESACDASTRSSTCTLPSLALAR